MLSGEFEQQPNQFAKVTFSLLPKGVWLNIDIKIQK